MMFWARQMAVAAAAGLPILGPIGGQIAALATRRTSATVPTHTLHQHTSIGSLIWSGLSRLFRVESASNISGPQRASDALQHHDHVPSSNTTALGMQRFSGIPQLVTPRMGIGATQRRSLTASAATLKEQRRTYVPWEAILEPARSPMIAFWGLDQAVEVKEPPQAFTSSPVKIVTGRDLKQHFLLAARPIMEGEVINIAAPYVKALGSFNRCKYCYHCHLRFEQPLQVKSKHTEDYFGFETCRDLFDETRQHAAPIHRYMVENIGTKGRGEDALFLHTGNQKVRVSQSDLDMVTLALEALVKRDAELRGELNRFNRQVNQVTWGDENCIELPRQPSGTETTLQPYHPTFDDFTHDGTTFASIPQQVIPHLERIADIVSKVLQATETSLDLQMQKEKLIELLYCCLRYKKPIVRGHGRQARQTGLGLYPVASYFAYDEGPNCDFYFDENTNMVVRAKRNINSYAVLTVGGEPQSLAEARRQELPWAKWLMDA